MFRWAFRVRWDIHYTDAATVRVPTIRRGLSLDDGRYLRGRLVFGCMVKYDGTRTYVVLAFGGCEM